MVPVLEHTALSCPFILYLLVLDPLVPTSPPLSGRWYNLEVLQIIESIALMSCSVTLLLQLIRGRVLHPKRLIRGIEWETHEVLEEVCLKAWSQNLYKGRNFSSLKARTIQFF
jgi:hypothetical protein